MAEGGQLTLVRTLDDVLDMRAWLGERRDWLACDVETTGLNVGRDVMRLVQLGDTERGWAWDYQAWRGLTKEVLEGYRGDICFWNALFDLKFLKKDGISVPQRWVHDGMIMAHLLDPVRAMGLKPTAVRLFGPSAAAGQDALKLAFSKGGWDFATIPTDHPAYWVYSALDTVLTARVVDRLWKDVQSYRHPYEVELGFIHVLRDAEIAGVGVDLDYANRAIAQLEFKMATLSPQIDELAGRPVRVGSDREVIAVLQEQGAVLVKRTPKGQLSTDGEVLKALAPRFPIAGLIKEWRDAAWLLTNHFRKAVELAVIHDGGATVHASTKPVGARTGRTSVTDPPLQTIPRGRSVRDMYLARPGHTLILCDYDGMEMRFMAGDAQCRAMLEAYARGEDVHRWVAAQVYAKEPEQVEKSERQVAKNAGFAKIYGAGVDKFALTAGVRVDQAQAFLDRYDELFPEVSVWQEGIINTVQSRRTREEWGYIETVMGRRLPVEPGEEYKAVNYRDQGSCAEIAKEAAIRLQNAGLGEYFRLFVHDEFILEVPEEMAGEILPEVEAAMRDPTVFDGLVFEAKGETVHRWGDKYGDEKNLLLEQGA